MHSKFLALALLALSLAACDREQAQREPAPAPKPEAPAHTAAAPATASATAAEPATVDPPPRVTKPAARSGELQVKRFVVASAVENREPVAAEKLTLGQGPVFAFAELENPGEAAKVVITFERDGTTTSVGHVELAVPAESKRWRTWGKSHLVKHEGRWSAVLRDEKGTELARQSFEIAPLTSAESSRMAPGT